MGADLLCSYMGADLLCSYMAAEQSGRKSFPAAGKFSTEKGGLPHARAPARQWTSFAFMLTVRER